MLVKKIGAKVVRDSRKQKTIQVFVFTSKGKFYTSAPAGKSTGKYEVKSYKKSLEDDIEVINSIDPEKFNDLNFKKFDDLKKLEKKILNKIGGNSLFALEASILKALAKEKNQELWEFLYAGDKKKIKFPRPVGNTIGGGLHSKGKHNKKPDFQEFLFIANGNSIKESVAINDAAYKLVREFLGFFNKKNDEGAYETDLSNEQVLRVMCNVQKIIKFQYKKDLDIGVDVASSSFFSKKDYVYKNPPKEFNSDGEVNYFKYLIKEYGLYYVEDPLDEEDFSNFSKLNSSVDNCLIVGDDLTTTNPLRLKKAIKNKSISGIIVKPNQIGSLLKVKEVMKLSKKYKIKTIISHRSGETLDSTIADLAVGFQSDFIKTGVFGKVRRAKLNRLIQIENSLLKK